MSVINEVVIASQNQTKFYQIESKKEKDKIAFCLPMWITFVFFSPLIKAL